MTDLLKRLDEANYKYAWCVANEDYVIVSIAKTEESADRLAARFNAYDSPTTGHKYQAWGFDYAIRQGFKLSDTLLDKITGTLAESKIKEAKLPNNRILLSPEQKEEIFHTYNEDILSLFHQYHMDLEDFIDLDWYLDAKPRKKKGNLYYDLYIDDICEDFYVYKDWFDKLNNESKMKEDKEFRKVLTDEEKHILVDNALDYEGNGYWNYDCPWVIYKDPDKDPYKEAKDENYDFPYQLYIDGKFYDALSKHVMDTFITKVKESKMKEDLHEGMIAEHSMIDLIYELKARGYEYINSHLNFLYCEKDGELYEIEYNKYFDGTYEVDPKNINKTGKKVEPGQFTESKMSDMYMDCEEFMRNNPNATEEDLAKEIGSEKLAHDYLTSIRESFEDQYEVEKTEVPGFEKWIYDDWIVYMFNGEDIAERGPAGFVEYYRPLTKEIRDYFRNNGDKLIRSSNFNESRVKQVKKLKESSEKDITVDFPIHINASHKVSANDAKKLLKYLAANKMLRLNRTWYVTDSEGNETCWDLREGRFDDYILSCEIAGEDENMNDYDTMNELCFSKSGKKLTDFEWNAYRV